MAEIARVLRPGGQVLACVDSLTFGMAVLAEQHRWPHLVDVPNADVVLIPWPDGTITRCYGAEQLRELFTGGGLEVDWIRPRTVFSPRDGQLPAGPRPVELRRRWLSAELRARSDDSVGHTDHLRCRAWAAGRRTGGHPDSRPYRRRGRVSTGRARIRGGAGGPRAVAQGSVAAQSTHRP